MKNSDIPASGFSRTPSANVSVLLVSVEFRQTTQSGAGVYAFEMATALAMQGVFVHVMAPASRSYTEQVRPGVIVHWQRTSSKPFLRVPSFYGAIAKSASSLVAHEGITTIHNNEYAGLTVPSDRPIVTTIHHPARCDFQNFRGVQRLFNLSDQLIERIVLRRSARVITDSHLSYDLLANSLPALTHKMEVVGVGVDVNRFRYVAGSTIRQAYGMDEDELLFFCPGGARSRRKGSETLFDALARLRHDHSFKCIVSGACRESGWQRDFMQSIRRHGLQDDLILPGEVAYDSLPHYYSSADIVVFPSAFEGFGIPVLEALSCERPIVASRTGESPYILSHGRNGMLVDPNNSGQLYDSLAALIGDRELRVVLGHEGRKTVVERYQWATVASKVIDNYLEVGRHQ